MAVFRKAATFFVAAIFAAAIAANGAFAQSPPTAAPLAPGGAAGVHVAEGFHPSDTLYAVAGIGLVVVGLALTQLHYHNPGNDGAVVPAPPAAASSTN